MTKFDYMKHALELSYAAAENNEVPVGALVVYKNEIISESRNKKHNSNNPIMHAEVIAIQLACKQLKRWRLTDCDVYVTLEPCIMCAGLMHQARIRKCFFGAYDSKAGALGSLYKINEDKRLNHNFDVEGGIMERQCAEILTDFFKKRR